MKRSVCAPLALTVILAVEGQALAQNEWCSTFTGSIFCDDFDRYCTSPPPYPAVCPAGSTKLARLHGTWAYTSKNYNTGSACGSDMTPEEIPQILPSLPYGGRHANGGDENGVLGQNTVDLTAYISDQMPGYTVANGSDAYPLVLTFTLGALDSGLTRSSGYMEMNLDDPGQYNPVNDPAQAPTDFVYVGADNGAGCLNCNATCTGGYTSVNNAWPSICQQEFPHALCPPVQTMVRHSLAIGALAMLDNKPCHCCTIDLVTGLCTADTKSTPQGYQEITNEHLSYFDGVKWRVLREGMGGAGSYGDFRYGNYILWGVDQNTDKGYETVVFTIKTSTVDIYHKTKMVDLVNGQWVETWVESMAYGLPRLYTGDFNRLRAGTGVGCQLNNSSYTCSSGYANGHKKCKVMGEVDCNGQHVFTRAKYVSFDNIKLSGGIGNVQIGACCRNDATCVETDLYTCETVLGGHYQGASMSCAATSCCPYPFADADHDGDVDQDDFGAFQICYTGASGGVPAGCSCRDRNKDGNVNDLDFTAFANCFTEANVKWTQPLTPSCTP